MQKILAKVEQDASLDAPAMTLPRMSFEIVNMTFSPERKLPSLNRNTLVTTDNNSKKVQFVPAPYDLEFQLNIMTKHTEDGTKILEQILPFFKPDVTISMKHIDEMDLYLDVPIILNSVTMDDAYEGDFLTRRTLTWTLNFTIRGYYFGPVSTKKLIKFVDTNIYDPIDANTSIAGITVQPGLTEEGAPTSILSGITATATTSVANGQVTSIDLTQNGSGYGYDTATAVISAPQTITATGTVNVGTESTNLSNLERVISVSMSRGGGHYSAAPAVNFSSPTLPAEAAVGVATTVGGQEIDDIKVYELLYAPPPVGGVVGTRPGITPGRYYTQPPTVTVDLPPASVTATGTVSVNANNELSVTITDNGTNYETAPTATISYTSYEDPYVSAYWESSIGYNLGSANSAVQLLENLPEVPQGGDDDVTNKAWMFEIKINEDQPGVDIDDVFVIKDDAEGRMFFSLAWDEQSSIWRPNFTYIDVVSGRTTTIDPPLGGHISAGSWYQIIIVNDKTYYGDPWNGFYMSYYNIENPNNRGASALSARFYSVESVSVNSNDAPAVFNTNNVQISNALFVVTNANGASSLYSNNINQTYDTALADGYEIIAKRFFEEDPISLANNSITTTTTLFNWQVTGVASVTPDTAVLSVNSVTFDAPSAVRRATAEATVANGRVTSVNVLDGGFGYYFSDFFYANGGLYNAGEKAEVVNFSAPTGVSSDFVATGTATITNGAVTGVAINNPGLGYTTNATISLTAPIKRTATATVNVDTDTKEVTSFNITDSGLGYLNPASIVVSDPDAVSIPYTDINEDDDWGFIVQVEDA
jgi:hypothetical protein